MPTIPISQESPSVFDPLYEQILKRFTGGMPDVSDIAGLSGPIAPVAGLMSKIPDPKSHVAPVIDALTDLIRHRGWQMKPTTLKAPKEAMTLDNSYRVAKALKDPTIGNLLTATDYTDASQLLQRTENVMSGDYGDELTNSMIRKLFPVLFEK